MKAHISQTYNRLRPIYNEPKRLTYFEPTYIHAEVYGHRRSSVSPALRLMNLSTECIYMIVLFYLSMFVEQ